MLNSFIEKNKLSDAFIEVATAEFIPLAEKIIAQQKEQGSPFIVGVNGCQGSGKSTLCDFLCDYMTHTYQLNVVVLSLDDFYYSEEKRAALAQEIHPLLATRGVPGTHDTQYIGALLDKLKNSHGMVTLPRFDKATDNPVAKENCPTVELPVDIVLFEGWCWGVYPQSEQQLAQPINELEQDADAQGIWRHYINRCLQDNYRPLYAHIDFWVLLKAPSFACVYQWRLEQEQKLRQKTAVDTPSQIMSDTEIKQFIKHFQRLTEHSIATMSDFSEVVFCLDEQRQIVQTLVQD